MKGLVIGLIIAQLLTMTLVGVLWGRLDWDLDRLVVPHQEAVDDALADSSVEALQALNGSLNAIQDLLTQQKDFLGMLVAQQEALLTNTMRRAASQEECP